MVAAGAPSPNSNQSPWISWVEGVPPGLRNVWCSGINVVTLEPLNADLFQPTFENGNQVLIHTASLGATGPDAIVGFLYPDHLSYDGSLVSDAWVYDKTIENYSDYSNHWGFDVSASVDTMGFSVSGNTSYSYQGTLFQSASSFYEVAYYVARTGRFRLETPAPLAPNFSNAVNGLVQAQTGSGDPAWTALFDTYGTHYLVSGDMGGIFILQQSTEQSSVSSSTAISLNASFQASFNDFIGGGSLSASAFSDVASKSGHAQSTSSYSCKCWGGIEGQSPQAFGMSSFWNPHLLTIEIAGICNRPTLRPISDLFSGANQKAVEAALDAYLNAPGAFGLAQAYQPNIVARAPSDGLLILTATTPGDSIVLATAPTAVDVLAQMQSTAGYMADAGSVSQIPASVGDMVWLPVAAGDYFGGSTLFSPSVPGGGAATLFFVPLLYTAPVFGPWSQATFLNPSGAGYTFTPPSDGFVTVSFEGNAGTWVTGDGMSVAIPAGLGSLTVPVSSGKQVEFQADRIYPTGNFRPLNPPYALALSNPVTQGQCALALGETGILIGVVANQTTNDAMFQISSAPTATQAMNDIQTATYVQWSASVLAGKGAIGIARLAQGDWVYPHSFSPSAAAGPVQDPVLDFTGILLQISATPA